MEGRTMSEPKRITEAELDHLRQGSRYATVSAAIVDIIRLAAEVRRLHGLIGPVCEASRAVSARLREVYRDEYIAKAASKEPECLLAKMVAMELAVEAADVEAEAIRAESKGEPHA
jgi:hypothetical protein